MRKHLAELARLHLRTGRIRCTASSLAGECIISDIKGRTCKALGLSMAGLLHYSMAGAHHVFD